MKTKKIDRIKLMLGKDKGLEAEGLPETSLIYLLLTVIVILAIGFVGYMILSLR